MSETAQRIRGRHCGRTVAIVLCLSFGPVTGTQADSTDPAAESNDVEVLVVTASAAPRERSALTSSVTLISADEIDFLKYDNVTELLRLAPGIHIEQPGSRGGRSSIYLRGLDPNHTLILIDGIRMGDPNNNLGG